MTECNVLQVLRAVLLLQCFQKAVAGSLSCLTPDTIDYSIQQEYCDQPLFVSVLPKTEEFQILDSICYTYFPLPDDPSTFTLYEAQVFCDGSTTITTYIGTQVGIGKVVFANPFQQLLISTIGYAGCETYITYGCNQFGVQKEFILTLSPICKAIGLSCLRKVQEILDERGIPEQDYYLLPMKLPNRCVTQQLCLNPPNPFYKNLPSVGLL